MWNKKPGFSLSDLKKSACSKLNGHLFINMPEHKRGEGNKYLNIEVQYDGKTFKSIKERDRYITLMWQFKNDDISEPLCQVEYMLETNKYKTCSYLADFVYTDLKTGLSVVEDVKSPKTRLLAVYRLKKQLMFAQYKIIIKEM